MSFLHLEWIFQVDNLPNPGLRAVLQFYIHVGNIFTTVSSLTTFNFDVRSCDGSVGISRATFVWLGSYMTSHDRLFIYMV